MNDSPRAPFRVGITRDCLGPDGTGPIFDPAAFAVLDAVPGLAWEFLPEFARQVPASALARYDAIVALAPAFTGASLADGPQRLKLLARFGAGYDTVDIPACIAAGVLVTNAPDGIRRPVAAVILTFILALSQKLMTKQRLAREGRWAERTGFMGEGLMGKVVGSIGLGNIAQESVRLLQPLGIVPIACSPRARPEDAAAMGVELVDLDTLLRRSDFVCINCPLTAETRGMIGARELGLMKPSAYLINTARGPIVDEPALVAALQERRIAGAGLDVFAEEPTPRDNPLLAMENVIATPHSLCWTDECFRLIAESAFGAVADVALGRRPRWVVNPSALEHARWAKRILQPS